MTHETVSIRFDKSHLVTIGEKLYGESLELLRELVSNAYDADAETVRIDVRSDCIVVRDDGWGMDEEGLREYFTIGSKNKALAPLSPRFGRRRIGQFGIGKFAVLSACERFRLRTQRSDFAGEIVFDKRDWEASDAWHVPLVRLTPDPAETDGTTVTLERLKRTFTPDEVERFIRERLPLAAPHFSIVLDGRRLEPLHVAGRRFVVDSVTPFGPIRGEIVVPNFPRGDEPGVECVVRGVVVRRSTFEMDLPVATRLRGRVEADFLPITSDRSRFIADSAEYRAFVLEMQKQIRTIDRLTREHAKRKEERKADEALKDTLVRLRRALKRNPDIAPEMLAHSGDAMKNPSLVQPAPSPGSDGGIAYHVSGGPTQAPGPAEHPPGEPEPPVRKVRLPGREGKAVTARKISLGGIGITCALEGLGRDAPPASTEAGVVYINVDHPLYRKQQERGQELLGFYLSCLLAQQVSLLFAEGDARKAFAMQNRLLTDSW